MLKQQGMTPFEEQFDKTFFFLIYFKNIVSNIFNIFTFPSTQPAFPFGNEASLDIVTMEFSANIPVSKQPTYLESCFNCLIYCLLTC